MAWRSSGTSNKELIENLWKNGLIKEPKVKEAFLKVNPEPESIPTGFFFG